MIYIASNGHRMVTVTDHTDKAGNTVPDYWNARHSATCPCLTSEDW